MFLLDGTWPRACPSKITKQLCCSEHTRVLGLAREPHQYALRWCCGSEPSALLQPIETNMINFAQFRIIGRIGKITATDKVTHLSVASDRSVKDSDGNWKPEPCWNSVTIFSERMRKRLANEKAGGQSNQVIVEGSIQENSYEKDCDTI